VSTSFLADGESLKRTRTAFSSVFLGVCVLGSRDGVMLMLMYTGFVA